MIKIDIGHTYQKVKSFPEIFPQYTQVESFIEKSSILILILIKLHCTTHSKIFMDIDRRGSCGTKLSCLLKLGGVAISHFCGV